MSERNDPVAGATVRPAAGSTAGDGALVHKDASPDHDDIGFGLKSRIVTASIVAGLLLVGGGGWSVMAKLSSAIIAQGRVVVEKNVKKLQHREGGVVAQITVSNGDKVKVGDILIRLSDAQVRVELDIVQSQLVELGARKLRLAAERNGVDTIDFAKFIARAGAGAANAAAGELRVFEDNKTTATSQTRQLQLRAEQHRQEIKGLSAQKDGKSRELKIVRSELKKLKSLYERKLATLTRVNALQRDAERLYADAGGLSAQIARTKGQISEVEIKILAIDQTARKDAQREFRSIEAKFNELESRYAAARDRLTRMDLRAPISGLVHELTVHTVGGVIAPGETVALIVPETDKLNVEARFSPVDIDQIIIGQKARLRFSAFNQRTTPELSGQVTRVSADITSDKDTGQSYYLGQLSIDKTELTRIGDRKLLPGMPVEVFITTRELSAISYFTKPFTDQLTRAFREE